MKNKIIVRDHEISVVKNDYISLTDIAKSKNPSEPRDVVKNWLRNKNTIEFIGLWEKINNPDFKGVEFDLFRNEAGLESLNEEFIKQGFLLEEMISTVNYVRKS